MVLGASFGATMFYILAISFFISIAYEEYSVVAASTILPHTTLFPFGYPFS